MRLISQLVLTCTLCWQLGSFFPACVGQPSIDEYLRQRADALNTESNLMLGSDVTLDTLESQVNEILMRFKQQEYKDGLDTNGDYFGATRHFFHSKPYIETSDVFKIIRMLPKGAALHMHDWTTGSSDYVAYNLTYWDNLYSCVGEDDHLLFHFFATQPTTPCYNDQQWRLVREQRSASSEHLLNEWFARSMSMVTQTPQTDYPTANRAWYWFEKKITTISGITNYEAAARDYYYHVMQEFLDDNVQYIEMRSLLSGLYRLTQQELTPLEAITVFKQVTDQFVAANPRFWGAKMIFAPHRFRTNSEMQNLVDQATVMKATYPDYFAGFDLVGQEDKGSPLIDFIPELLDAAAKGIKFFFHSGETDWRGTKIDENILDAILLNTTRFGHGYAIAAHPHLTDLAKQKGMAVEACPISNQVLRLVEDFRNHPASMLLRKDFPLVIASDGPGIWGSTGLSHDWYITFMAIAGQRGDLRMLKQLAINSIEYSAMSENEKSDARANWEVEWERFLEDVIARYGPNEDETNAAHSLSVSLITFIMAAYASSVKCWTLSGF